MSAHINLTGRTVGSWLVGKKVGQRKSGTYIYNCTCKCGVIKAVASNHLRSGNTSSCASCSKQTTGIFVGRAAWITAVKIRDNYTCLKCNKKGGELHAHHIISKENIELRYQITNGATLCKKCHTDFHNVYGKLIHTVVEFQEFLAEKVYNYETV